MAKVTAGDITSLGFKKEMFGRSSDAEFTTFINDVISDQAALLEGRVGSSVYADTTSPVKDYVKRAEKALCAAEMVSRRINIVLGNITGTGQELDITSEEKQRDKYLEEAENRILKLTAYAGDSGDVCFGVIASSHFGDDDA
jgi:hypothetical protein